MVSDDQRSLGAALAHCRKIEELVAGPGSFRLRVLLEMLSIELAKEAESAARSEPSIADRLPAQTPRMAARYQRP